MAQVAWPSPSLARGRILEIRAPGDPEIWDPRNRKSKLLKSKSILPKIAQTVGKVWISRKILLAIFGAILAIYSMGRKMQKMNKVCLFSLLGQWALFTRFGVMRWCHLDLH